MDYIGEGLRRDANRIFTVWDLAQRRPRVVITERAPKRLDQDVATDGLSLAAIDDDGIAQDLGFRDRQAANRVSGDDRSQAERQPSEILARQSNAGVRV